MNQQNDVIEIDLREIVLLIGHHLLAIIATTVAAALAAGLISVFALTPMYTSTSQIYILTNSGSVVSLTDLQMGSSLANDYEELIKSRERKVIEDKGLDPDDVAPIVEQLVKERIDKDPRMQELEELRQMRVQEFGKKELAEVTKLSGGEITSLNQLSPEVISAWKQKGSLKAAYLEVEGEKRIMRMMSDQSRGTTTHLTANGGSAAVPTGERNLTADEKKMYKFFNPSMTDDQLNKITVKEN